MNLETQCTILNLNYFFTYLYSKKRYIYAENNTKGSDKSASGQMQFPQNTAGRQRTNSKCKKKKYEKNSYQKTRKSNKTDIKDLPLHFSD